MSFLPLYLPLSIIYTFFLWSHWGTLLVSMDCLWYWKLLVSVTSNTLWCCCLKQSDSLRYSWRCPSQHLKLSLFYIYFKPYIWITLSVSKIQGNLISMTHKILEYEFPTPTKNHPIRTQYMYIRIRYSDCFFYQLWAQNFSLVLMILCSALMVA